MSLPAIPLPEGVLFVDGVEFRFHALSRAAATGLASHKGDVEGGEASVIAEGMGVSYEEALQWRRDTPTDVVGQLVDAILALSGLSEGAQKSS